MTDRLPGAARADLPARMARILLCVALMLGLLLRVVVILSEPMGPNAFSDDNAYLSSAAVFVKTGYVTYAVPDVRSGVLGPGMPLLLGFLFLLLGYQPVGLLLSHIAFSAIGLVTALGGYLLGRQLHSRRAGVLAAAFLALEPGLAAANCMFYTETPYMCLNLFALYTLLRCAQGWRPGLFLAGVACVCGAAAFKGLELLVPLCVGAYLLVRRVPLWRWLPRAGLAALLCALVFLPWCVRNWQVVGTFTPFPVSQGDQKLLGSYVGWGYPEGSYEEGITELDARAWTEGYQADAYRRIALRGEYADERMARWLRENPLGFLGTHLLYKPISLLLMEFYPHRVPGVPQRYAQALWWALVALAVWGLSFGRPRKAARRAGFYFPALYLGLALLLTAMYVPLTRYNAPHAPLILLYASVGVCDLWRRASGLGRPRLRPACLPGGNADGQGHANPPAAAAPSDAEATQTEATETDAANMDAAEAFGTPSPTDEAAPADKLVPAAPAQGAAPASPSI